MISGNFLKPIKNINKICHFYFVKQNAIRSIFLSTANYQSISSSRSIDHESNNRTNWMRGLTGATLIGAIIGYKYLSKDKDDVGIFNWPFQTVSAATVVNQQSNRFKYNFFADVVEKCSPTVVYIEIKDTRRFDYFTGEPFTASNGSGFIVEPNGLILTNAHVVINKPHTIAVVKLQDGRSFKGVVESVDPTSDLATVRIQCTDLPTLKLGNSSDLRAGEWVVALGSPLALSNTVTAGVISSTQRASKDLGLRGTDINYLQTDAAITFGNSGGPLINLDGEAIGLNSMKVTAGISFAIPIDYVKEFLKRSQSHGRTNALQSARRYMGITMLSLTDEIVKELRSRSNTFPTGISNGVLVWKVMFGSPADTGGLNPGDIITQINGKAVKSSSDVYAALAQGSQTLNMSIYRGLNQMNITITPENFE